MQKWQNCAMVQYETANSQNPLHTFPRNFPIDAKAANLLRTCYGETGVKGFGINYPQFCSPISWSVFTCGLSCISGARSYVFTYCTLRALVTAYLRRCGIV